MDQDRQGLAKRRRCIVTLFARLLNPPRRPAIASYVTSFPFNYGLVGVVIRIEAGGEAKDYAVEFLEPTPYVIEAIRLTRDNNGPLAYYFGPHDPSGERTPRKCGDCERILRELEATDDDSRR